MTPQIGKTYSMVELTFAGDLDVSYTDSYSCFSIVVDKDDVRLVVSNCQYYSAGATTCRRTRLYHSFSGISPMSIRNTHIGSNSINKKRCFVGQKKQIVGRSGDNQKRLDMIIIKNIGKDIFNKVQRNARPHMRSL